MTGNFGQQLKADLAAQKPLLVVNIDYTNASLVEFLGRNGADVIFIDCEQGDTDFQSIPDLVRAAHIAQTPIIVRLPSSDPAIIERYMFRGVDGIVVPRLTTPEQAEAVVEAVRYCFPADHAGKAIIIQIEDIAAVDALEGFLDVVGIDCLFVGPVDLAKSMGRGGDYNDPLVAETINNSIARAVAAGQSVGMLAKPETISTLTEQGVSFLYVHTNDFLRIGAAHLVAVRIPVAPTHL